MYFSKINMEMRAQTLDIFASNAKDLGMSIYMYFRFMYLLDMIIKRKQGTIREYNNFLYNFK